jgi:hypothetical protein
MSFQKEWVFQKRSKFGVWQPRYFRGEEAPRRVLYAHSPGESVGDQDGILMGILIGELSAEIELLSTQSAKYKSDWSDSAEKGDQLRLKGMNVDGSVRELYLRDDPTAPGSLRNWKAVLDAANQTSLRKPVPALKTVGWWDDAHVPDVQPKHAYALALAFRLFDYDCNLCLDPTETKDLLVAFGRPASSVEGLIVEHDTDRNGMISFDEFVHLFNQRVEDVDEYTLEATEERWKIDLNLESRQKEYNMCADKHNAERDLKEGAPGWRPRFEDAELDVVKKMMEREHSAHALGVDTVRHLLAQPCNVPMCGCAVM